MSSYFAQNYRSGRGKAVPASSHRVDTEPRQQVGRPPLPPFQKGSQGNVSASPDVMASLFVGGFSGKGYYDDQFDGEFFDEYDPEEDDVMDDYILPELEDQWDDLPWGYAAGTTGKRFQESLLRTLIRETIYESKKELLTDEDEDVREEEEVQDEISAAGAVAGYTMPLGMAKKGPSYDQGGSFARAKPPGSKSKKRSRKRKK
jgi:hypothetical protein